MSAAPTPPLPGFLTLVGDEDGGVTLTCSHPSHSDGGTAIIYLGPSAPAWSVVADDLNGLLRCAYLHADAHRAKL